MGRGFNPATGKHDGEPFRSTGNNKSDLDIAIANPKLFEKAKQAGIPLNGRSWTRPLRGGDLKKLGLKDFGELSFDTNGYTVSIMIFETPKSMNNRGQNIRLNRKK